MALAVYLLNNLRAPYCGSAADTDAESVRAFNLTNVAVLVLRIKLNTMQWE